MQRAGRASSAQAARKQRAGSAQAARKQRASSAQGDPYLRAKPAIASLSGKRLALMAAPGIDRFASEPQVGHDLFYGDTQVLR